MKLSLANGARVGGLLLLAYLIYLTASASPAPNFLWLELTPDSDPLPDVKAHFLQGGQAVHHGSALSVEHASGETIAVPLPSHFQADGVFLDMGVEPGKWKISRAYVTSRWLMFNLRSQQWRGDALYTQLAPYLDASLLEGGATTTITTLQKPYRFHITLDPAAWQLSFDAIFSKLAIIVALFGIYVLLSSNYFRQLFQTRRHDMVILRQRFNKAGSKFVLERVLGAGLLLVLMVVVGYEIILRPGLFVEDSMEFSDVLKGGLNLFDPATYEYYRGYQVFLTKLIVQLVYQFPLEWQPYLYALAGMLMTWVAMITLNRSGLIQHPVTLLFAPALIFAGSFAIPPMYLTLTGIFFSSTALLIVLLLRPTPNKWVHLAAWVLWLCALAWSGPYAPQILPIALALILMISSGRKTAVLAVMMGIALLYTMNSATNMVQLENILDPYIRSQIFDALVVHLFLFGLTEEQNFKVGILVIALIISLLVWYRDDRIYVKHSLVLCMSSVISLATYYLSFKYHQYNGELITAHIIIAQFIWMLFIVLTLDKILGSLQQHISTASKYACVLALLCAFFAAKQINASPNDHISPDEDLITFIKAVKYVQSMPLEEHEFVQLWDVNSQAYVTSFKVGGDHPEAVSVAADRIPRIFQNFFLPFDLQRQRSTHMQYLFRESTISASNQNHKKIPPEVAAYHREKFRQHF